MKAFEDNNEREQAVCVGAAAAAFAMLMHDGILTDAKIDAAFAMAERFVAKVEQRLANTKGTAP